MTSITLAMSRLPPTLALLWLLYLVSTATATTIPSEVAIPTAARNIRGSLDCRSADITKRILCQVVLEKIDDDMRKLRLVINRGGALFTLDDPKRSGIPTGHSCSVTAEVRRKQASAHVSRSAQVNLVGKSLSQNLAVRLRLPVNVNARVTVRQRFGVKFFRKCRRYARDTYVLKAGLRTVADAVVGFALNPSSCGLSDAGDYVVTVAPRVALLFQLRNADLKFRVSGVSPITSVWTAVVGIKSTIGSSINSLFKGRSLKSIWKKIKRNAPFDLGAPIALGIGALPRPLEALVFDKLSSLGTKLISKAARKVTSKVEQDLNADIARALKLVGGKRTFVIKKNVVEILRLGGKKAEIFIQGATHKCNTRTPKVVPSKPKRRCRRCRRRWFRRRCRYYDC